MRLRKLCKALRIKGFNLKIIVGLNAFTGGQEITPPTFRVDNNVGQLQTNKLKALKTKKDHEKVVSCLKKLKRMQLITTI